MTDDSLSEFDPLNSLAEEFLTRHRRGERPAVSEYTARYPDLAERIRDLFPALLLVEEFGPRTHESTGPTKPMALHQLGEYRLVREIGRGGMGIVYEAVQESLSRRVAVKVLAPSLRHGKFLERFRREAKSAARLHHTNIVPVFGVGEHDGQPYYVMQFIDGRGLDAVLAGMKTPADFSTLPTAAAPVSPAVPTASFVPSSDPAAPTAEVRPAPASRQPDGAYIHRMVQLGLQAAEGLAYAHAQGVLHRDIKPANLLLDTQGTLWIADFGLAKADDSDNLTEQGGLVGTLRYIAPERFQGLCDPRADIYALGVTLYEMLTLRPAFDAVDRASLLDQIARRAVTPPRRLAAAIPLDLETIVLKAMAHEPGDRYTTGEVMAEDLRRFLADRPILARRSSLLERLRRWRRRNPVVAALTGMVALLLMLLALGSTLAALGLSRSAEQARRSEHIAVERLFDASLSQARLGRFSGQVGQRFESWKALEQAADCARSLRKKPADLLALRNEAIACLTLPDLRLEQEWEGNPPGTNGLAFDAHFARYAWSYKNEDIRICDAGDRREILRLPDSAVIGAEPWRSLHFSPSGRFLTVWNYYRAPRRLLQVWEIKPETVRPLLAIADASGDAAFGPEERTLAVGMPDHSVAIFDLKTGKETRRLFSGFHAERLAFSPDGRRLALASTERTSVWIGDLQSGKTERILSHPAGVQGLAWHPDGCTLATGCDDHRIYLWNTDAEGPPNILEGHRWEVYGLAFDPSGDWLLSFGWDMTLRLWDVRTRRQLLSLPRTRGISVGGDEKLMAARLNGRRIQLFHFVPSRAQCVLHGHQKPIHCLRFSPDSHCLASAGEDGHFSLWDVATARQVARQADLPSHYLEVLWEPAGSSLLAYSRSGLRRWPLLDPTAQSKAQFRFGPAQLLLPPLDGQISQIASFGDHDRFLGAVSYPQHAIDVIQLGSPPRKLWTHQWPHVRYLAGSPDGRWLAAGTFGGGSGVRVWETRSGQLVKDWPIGDAVVAFSPDGKWLAATTARNGPDGAECRTWRSGTWEEGPRTALEWMSSSPPPLTFAPDGKLLAVAQGTTEVRLLDAVTLAEIAVLVPPEPRLILPLAFSPDSSQLAVAAQNRIQLWDLRYIRAHLKELGLDWDAPDYPR